MTNPPDCRIDPSSRIHPEAVLGADVTIGAFCVVEAGVRIGDGCMLADHVIVRAGSELGRGVHVDSFAVVGGMPQMRGPAKPAGRVRIGDRSVLREGVTVHRPTRPEGTTSIGEDCFLMAHSHVGHDSVIGNSVTLANNVMLAGHVQVGDSCFVGGGAGIHQFVRIGRGAMIAGNASISYDVPPYAIAADRNDVCGLNLVGMRRQGLPSTSVADVKRCFHAVFRGPGNLRERAAEALREAQCGQAPEGRHFLEFFGGGKRGFARERSDRNQSQTAE